MPLDDWPDPGLWMVDGPLDHKDFDTFAKGCLAGNSRAVAYVL